jgi:hypothetical protein
MQRRKGAEWFASMNRADMRGTARVIAYSILPSNCGAKAGIEITWIRFSPAGPYYL